MKLIRNIVKQFKQASLCSYLGIRATWHHQLSFRIEVFAFLIAFLVALLIDKTAAEKAVLISSIFLILIVEVINSAIETIVDRISLEHNPLSGKAKDIASAAVLLTIINASFVWGIIIFL